MLWNAGRMSQEGRVVYLKSQLVCMCGRTQNPLLLKHYIQLCVCMCVCMWCVCVHVCVCVHACMCV